MDPPEVILRKFKRAVTDSEGGIYRSPDKPGVSNLIEIYAAVTGKSPEAVEQEFSGQGYGALLKPAVGEAVVEAPAPFERETQRLLADKAYLRASTARGRKKPLPWRTGPCVKCIRRWASFPADGGAAQTCLSRRSQPLRPKGVLQ